MKKLLSLLAIVGILIYGCDNSTDKNEININELYHNAVLDAIIADSSEIAYNLIDITESNPYLIWKMINGKKHLLATTVTTYKDSYKVNDSVNTVWGESWITVAPEMKDFFKTYQYSNDSTLQLRVLQLLGMPATDKNNYIIEFWVDPDSIFRPTPDNEITDKKSDLYFTSNVSQEYKKWFNDNIVYSYFPQPGKSAYPWTRLGYTYDWAPKANERGLSEFVVKRNTKLYIKSNQSLYDYIYKN